MCATPSVSISQSPHIDDLVVDKLGVEKSFNDFINALKAKASELGKTNVDSKNTAAQKRNEQTWALSSYPLDHSEES